MQISFYSGNVAAAQADLLILGVFEGAWQKSKVVQLVDRALAGALTTAARDERFVGKPKQKLILSTFGKLRCKRVALMGLGREAPADAAMLLRLGGNATRLARGVGAKSLVLSLPFVGKAVGPHLVEATTRGLVLGGYRFERYLSERSRAPELAKAVIAFGDGAGPLAEAKRAALRGQAVAAGVMVARDLVNEPGMTIYPESFAAAARKLATANRLKVRVYGPAELEKMGARLILGVGAGSVHRPRLVHLTYAPAGRKTKRTVALVGKGVTFDSGGLNIKGTGNIETMHHDMAGAAAVLGAMVTLSKLKPNLTVHGIMALAENMPSGSAIRPSDVVRSASGKYVEINNTDAEGRLVLADALHFATELGAHEIVDLATLTGAAKIALGPTTAALFANDDALAAELLASAERAGEDAWRMPLIEALREQLKSDVADMKNTGERFGGAITGALFLREFVGKAAWAHLDIAGPADSTQEDGAFAKGGTGVGVATLVNWLAV